MATKLEELKAKQKALKEEISANAKDALGEAFGVYFTEHPTVTAVRWRQYTPYFNDGDACEFGVHDFEYRKKDQTAKAAETDGRDEEDEDDEDWIDSYGGKGREASGLRALAKLCDEAIMLEAFGDHCEVTATRDGFDVVEYSHD